MIWKNPDWFWALLIIPTLVALFWWRHRSRRQPALTYSDTSDLKGIGGNWRKYGNWIVLVLQMAGVALITTALARPQLENVRVERSAKGIDIMLVLDMSTSMKAEDLKPNRFLAAKKVAAEFISKRISDRIGLVVFAAKSFTVVPPTLDYRLLKSQLRNVHMGMVEDGTAIGMGIATAVNRLKDMNARSKVIIMLTDGENNAGEIDPVTAADLAKAYDIKIYTIGVGTHGMAPYPVEDPIFGKRYQNIKVDVDEKMLKKVAAMTGGEYFRATSTNSLEQIYDRINKMEKTKVDEQIFTDYKDLYPDYLLPGILVIVLAFIGDKWVFRSELS